MLGRGARASSLVEIESQFGEDWQAGGSIGDIIDSMYKEGHVRDELYVICLRLLDDMRRTHGTSGGIVLELGERVQTSVRERTAPPGGGDPDAFDRMERALSKLRAHEREMMAYLIRTRELPPGGLAHVGQQSSGYKHARSARAYMTGRIVALLESIAEVYPRGA